MCMALSVAAAFAAVTMARADYRYIISGEPADTFRSCDSDAIELEGGTRWADSTSEDTEIRFFSWTDSVPCYLNTFPPCGFLLLLQ